MSSVQLFIAAVLPTLAVLVGILLNSQRMNDLSAQFAEMIGRIDGLRDTLRAEMAQNHAEVMARLNDLESRVSQLERAA